jgi:two-component sensor histidine kinase
MGVLARMALGPLLGQKAPFALGFVAVVCATILGGWRTGLVASLVGQVLTWFVIYEPAYSFNLLSEADRWTMLVASVCQLVVVTAVALYQKEIGRQQETREILVAELNHRVKNTLAIVQSLAQQTFRRGTKEDTAMFEQRLQALAGAHNLLTSNNWVETELEEVIQTALLPFGLKMGRVIMRGPKVSVPPKTAVNLTLVVHELATNAVKYGALSNESGNVDISWADGQGFPRTFTWRENGGPTVAPPTRNGFGTRLIRRGLAAELGAKVHLDFEPDGLQCRLEMV